MGKAGKKFIYKNIEYDSPEEIQFVYWIEELCGAGYINNWKRVSEKLELSKAVKSKYKEKNKTKEQSILQNLEYKSDFVISWHKCSENVFYNVINNGKKINEPFIASEIDGIPVSYVEVKGMWDANNMTRLFRHNQKIVYKLFNLFINLAIPEKLFNNTFTPVLATFTPTGKKRTITKWKVRTLKEFLESNNKK